MRDYCAMMGLESFFFVGEPEWVGDDVSVLGYGVEDFSVFDAADGGEVADHGFEGHMGEGVCGDDDEKSAKNWLIKRPTNSTKMTNNQYGQRKN